jgi:hypothetical protein
VSEPTTAPGVDDYAKYNGRFVRLTTKDGATTNGFLALDGEFVSVTHQIGYAKEPTVDRYRPEEIASVAAMR